MHYLVVCKDWAGSAQPIFVIVLADSISEARRKALALMADEYPDSDVTIKRTMKLGSNRRLIVESDC